MGLMTVQNTLNNLSMGKVLAGLTLHENRGNKEADNRSDVGTTGLEGFPPPFLTQVLQRVQNDSIGDEQEQKHYSADQSSTGCN